MSDVKIYHQDKLPKGVKIPDQHQDPSATEGEPKYAGENHRLSGASDIYYAVKGKSVVGHVAQNDKGKVQGVYIDPEHRGKGVATEMYHHVANTTGSIHSDHPDAMESSAKSMWSKMKSKNPGSVSHSKEGFTLKGSKNLKKSEVFNQIIFLSTDGDSI